MQTFERDIGQVSEGTTYQRWSVVLHSQFALLFGLHTCQASADRSKENEISREILLGPAQLVNRIAQISYLHTRWYSENKHSSKSHRCRSSPNETSGDGIVHRFILSEMLHVFPDCLRDNVDMQIDQLEQARRQRVSRPKEEKPTCEESGRSVLM